MVLFQGICLNTCRSCLRSSGLKIVLNWFVYTSAAFLQTCKLYFPELFEPPALSPSVPQAVRLESGWSDRVRYMVVIYTTGHQDTEENVVLGMDFTDKDR